MARYCGLQITNSQSPIADYVANDGRTYEVVNITTIKVKTKVTSSLKFPKVP